MHRVAVIGGVSYDTLVYFDTLPEGQAGTVFSRGSRETVGSTGAAKALALNRLGFDVTLHALIGDDPAGASVRSYFEREKLRFVAEPDPQGTERHINLMDKHGDRLSIYASYATFDPVIDLKRVERLIAESDIVVLNIINYCRRLIPICKRYNKPIWCDIHNYDGKNAYHQDFIEGADLLFLSDEWLSDTREFMQAQVRAGKRFVVCTHGKRGSTALDSEYRWTETPALDYPLVDSNGAGDNFMAGVLYGWLRGYSLERALRCGTIVGGLCITSSEPFDTMLSVDKLEAEYTRQYSGL